MSLPSSSSVQRAMACPASTALPQVGHVGSEDQSRGIAVHAFIADVKALGRAEALERCPKRWRLYCESIPLDDLHLERFLPEPAFALNVTTGKVRLLGQNIGREYVKHGGDPENEIFCTPDGVGISEDAVYVVDWKSGMAYVPRPVENWQIRVGSICAATYYQKQQAVGEITHLPQSPTDDPWRQRDTFDLLQIDGWLEELLEAVPVWRAAQAAEREGRPLAVVTGSHCQFCPCVASCPATGALMRTFAGLDPAKGLGELTPETAKLVREQFQRHKQVMEMVDAALKAYASSQPIPTSTAGKFYGLRTVEREELDPRIVFDLVREQYGEEFARKAVSWEATKTGLEEVAREIAAATGSSSRETMRGLLAAIRERGGSRTLPQQQYREFKPKGESP